MKIILASSSPRRAEILRNAGIDFEISPVDLDETRFSREPAPDYVQRVAIAKARGAGQALSKSSEPAIVIAADTTVVAAGEILEKPFNADDARRMLRLQRGTTSEVLTALSILAVPDGRAVDHVEITRIKMLNLSDQDIDDYIASGEPFDKAGGWGIQGLAGKFVSKIEGCYFNVMGLPISWVWSTLKKFDALEK
jgi:septum formation protein